MASIIVVAGIVEHENKILICQRSYPVHLAGKWEFPGGKVEPNESHKDGLLRELHEELGITVEVKELYEVVEHGNISLHAYKAQLVSEELSLKEHIAYQWIRLKQLSEYDFAPADQPIVRKLIMSGM